MFLELLILFCDFNFGLNVAGIRVWKLNFMVDYCFSLYI